MLYVVYNAIDGCGKAQGMVLQGIKRDEARAAKILPRVSAVAATRNHSHSYSRGESHCGVRLAVAVKPHNRPSEI